MTALILATLIATLITVRKITKHDNTKGKYNGLF